MRMGPSGKAAARAVLLTRSDVGSGWSGGPAKPDLSLPGTCPNYRPRVSDLVLNGAAKASYKQPGFVISSASQVLGSAKMVRLDWQRSVASRNFLACQRKLIRKSANGKGALVSLRRIVVPRVGDFSDGYRVILDVKTKRGKVRMVVDTVAFTKGRTEMALSLTMPIASVPALFPNEAIFVKLMAGRVRA
jgi:hypothetical protein